MQKVLGFGGFFFRSQDPKALAQWYHDVLGVRRTPSDYAHAYWVQERGPTVFQPFPHTTEYFGNPANAFMLNFRVPSLAAMITQLEAAGVEVEVDPQEHPNGIFARFQDPEGNPVAIWQPKGDELSLPEEALSRRPKRRRGQIGFLGFTAHSTPAASELRRYGRRRAALMIQDPRGGTTKGTKRTMPPTERQIGRNQQGSRPSAF